MADSDYQPGEGDDADDRAGRAPAQGGGVAWCESDSYSYSANHDGYQYRFRYIYKDGYMYRYAVPIRNAYVQIYSHYDTSTVDIYRHEDCTGYNSYGYPYEDRSSRTNVLELRAAGG
ncbi:MAG: hypothetical protein FJZ90_00090 [Chloroflexi bacterium]|nr:hypothetical protein [Chloroflexota bacterium]